MQLCVRMQVNCQPATLGLQNAFQPNPLLVELQTFSRLHLYTYVVCCVCSLYACALTSLLDVEINVQWL